MSVQQGKTCTFVVQIAVRAQGLNFKDVLNVLGMYPGDPGPPGLDCAGVVTAVGEGVTDKLVGDEVFGVAPGCLGHTAFAPAEAMVRKPRTVAFSDAATAPTVFCTVLTAFADGLGPSGHGVDTRGHRRSGPSRRAGGSRSRLPAALHGGQPPEAVLPPGSGRLSRRQLS